MKYIIVVLSFILSNIAFASEGCLEMYQNMQQFFRAKNTGVSLVDLHANIDQKDIGLAYKNAMKSFSSNIYSTPLSEADFMMHAVNSCKAQVAKMKEEKVVQQPVGPEYRSIGISDGSIITVNKSGETVHVYRPPYTRNYK